MLVHRLASARYAPDNAEGARLYGGRWNRKGIPVIYTSPTVSLAAAEVIVHYGLIPVDYRVIDIEIPDSLEIESFDIGRLGPDWHHESSVHVTALYGQCLGVVVAYGGLSCSFSGYPNRVQLHLEFPLHQQFKELRFSFPAEEIVDPRLRDK